MLKAKMKKSLSVLLSATMLASMFTSFAVTASADNTEAQAEKAAAVQTFTEDFSSYTEETVSTSDVAMTSDKAGTVAATHPSGAKWLVSTTDAGRGVLNDSKGQVGKYSFDVKNDRLYVRGMAWVRAALNLDMSAVNRVKNFKSFTFTTSSAGETEGVRLFVNNDENTFIEFAIAGYRDCGIEKDATNGPVPQYQPKVVFSNNGTRTVLFNSGEAVTLEDGTETTRGNADGWIKTGTYDTRYVKWNVTVNDDGSLSWNAQTIGGAYGVGAAKSSGTVSADVVATALANYKYPLAVTGDGDIAGGYVKDISFKYVPDYSVSLTEDFSSYTEETVSTSDVAMTSDKAGTVAATHPSGAKWLVSTTDAGRGVLNDSKGQVGKYSFDVKNDRLYVRGMAWVRAALNFDMSAVGNVKSFEKFTFTTSSAGETEGVRLFVNNDENTFIEFAIAGNRECGIEKNSTNGPVPQYQPKVVFSNNGARTVLFNSGEAVTLEDGTETTRGNADGWIKTGTYDTRYVKWNVTVNDDGSLSWNAQTIGGAYGVGAAKSSGTVSADVVATALANYKYPLAVTGDGDIAGGYVKDISIAYVPDNSLTFTEDFSSYTAENVATSLVHITNNESEKIIATHPSGAIWRAPKTAQARGNGNSWYKFDVNSNELALKGYWDHYRSSLNLDTSKVLDIDKFQEFSFTVKSSVESGGARLFVNENENSYLEFVITGHREGSAKEGNTVPAFMPKVVYANNGTRTVLFNAGEKIEVGGEETTRGAADGWKYLGKWDARQVKWDVVINDDNSITWTATTVGGKYTVGEAVSTGTISADIVEPLMENYRYPVAFTADGDDSDNMSRMSKLSFKYESKNKITAPTFSDDFTGYVKDENTVTESFLIQNNRKVLGTHSSGAKWITSNKNSYNTYSNYGGRAYIDIVDNKLGTVGWGTWHVQRVLLDYSDKKFDIDKVAFSSDMGSGRMIGLSMFVDGANENNYLFFGQMSNESSVFNVGDKYQPYSPIIVKSVKGVTSVLHMTEKTAGDNWDITDKALDWTVEFDENNNINWTATSSRGKTASGTITADDEVKAIIEANWAYPLAATATGDGFSFINSVDMWTSNTRSVEYEKKAYTRDEFKALFDNAEYGKTEEVEKLMKLDLGSVDGGKATAEISLGTTAKTITPAVLGTHTEYNSGYNGLVKEDGSLTDEYLAAAKSMTEIASYRIGGGSSTGKNMLKDLRDEDSYYLSADKLPDHMKEKAGTVSNQHGSADLATLINAALANNPNATFNLCISPYTTTPEEVSELINVLTGSDYSYRVAYGLPKEPLKIEYIELGNELEHFNDMAKSAEFAVWYGNRMPDYISVIEAADPSIKIMANGMTCPWGGEETYGFWLDMIAATRTVNGNANYRIVDHIDTISFHPYNSFGHGGIDYVLGKADVMKAYLNNKAPGNNIKFSVTEYGVNWRDRGTTFGSIETYSLKSAMMNVAFIMEAIKNENIDHNAMYAHCTMGQMWARMTNNIVTPLGDAYSFLASEWLNTVYDTEITVNDSDNIVGSYDNYFTAVGMKDSSNTLKFIVSNAADYKSVETKFNIPAGYTLVNEKVLTTPNVYSSVYNANCANLATVTSNDVEVENFNTYTIPSKSIVVLTLKAADGKSDFVENFDYADATVTASNAVSNVVTNANGAKWVTSAANNGLVEADGEELFDDVYGTVSVNNKALEIKTYNKSDKATSANWDISAVSEKPSDISEISFTVTGANGGVKLFADSSEKSKFDFSNKNVGLTGTVNWTIAIADGTLTWTASNGTTDKTGTIAVSADDMTGYAYLASAYLSSNVIDSASFDNFLFRYGNAEAPALEGVTYVNNANTVDVTVNPSVYGKTSARVLVGYYNGDALVGANTTVVTADGQIFNSAKPASTYTTAKIFVWDDATQSPLTTEVAVN